jgi:hypothetical protein
MRSSFGKVVLLAGTCSLAGLFAWGKTSTQPASPSMDLAITYDAVRANIVPGSNFWMQGGSAQFHGQFWHGLGVVADVGAFHTGNEHGTGVGLDLVTATFGPRYTQSLAHHRYALFGQALAGETHGFNSAFPAAAGVVSSTNGLALQVGGGMNLQFSRHIAIRAIEADWLRTQLPNATTGVENNLHLGSGLVFKF